MMKSLQPKTIVFSALMMLFFTASGSLQLTAQPYGDLGDGYYRNPVLIGNRKDATVVRVGPDYYVVGENLSIWHSTDLVNWKNIGNAKTNVPKNVHHWAPDISYVDDTFYIYTTFVDRSKDPAFVNVVLTAKNPAGPWSAPIDLKLYGIIDPGHLTAQDGRRYLYLEKGFVAELSADGTKTIGKLIKVYDGWIYPSDWKVECFCLEGPKLFFYNGYYYMLSAEGGTSGPPTAHMVIAARSKSPIGPWENSPHNPMVRTASDKEFFWRQGHGQIVDDVNGNWWMLYTGYNNKIGYGKLLLLLPIEWTPDGWPIVPPGIKPTDKIKKPLLNIKTCGDVNNDKKVSIIDALTIARHAVNLPNQSFHANVADVNNDGSVSILDALLVAQYTVGLLDRLHCK